METFSALLAIYVGNSPVPGEFPAHRPVTRSFDIFLICVWINGWVNNREAGDLRRYRAHYDVIVIWCVSIIRNWYYVRWTFFIYLYIIRKCMYITFFKFNDDSYALEDI